MMLLLSMAKMLHKVEMVGLHYDGNGVMHASCNGSSGF